MVIVRTDPFSQASLFTRFKFNETVLACATSFFYRINEELFLVSNWHNYSGRRPDSGETLSETKGIPNIVACYLCLDRQYINREWHEFSLYDGDGPCWYEHPAHGRKVDIGVLPIRLPEKFRSICINELPQSNLRLRVSSDVFILGYPFGLTDVSGMPVWKRASVATEPGTSQPSFLVDTATRSGMSGSPVLHRFRGLYKHDETSKNLAPNDWIGEGDDFVGVYSGRLGDDELKAQLGIVWKRSLIDEIARGCKRYES